MRRSVHPLTVALLSLLIAGCYRCGDGICGISHAFQSDTFDSALMPKVSLSPLSEVRFEAPPELRRKHNVIRRIWVYEEGGGIVWEIAGKSPRGGPYWEGPEYDSTSPIVYGKLVDGATQVVAPRQLEIGRTYSMRGNFLAYDQISVLHSVHVKVTFRLARDGDRLIVERLITNRAG